MCRRRADDESKPPKVVTPDDVAADLRVIDTPDGVTLEVCSVVWADPATPTSVWQAYRSWPSAPRPDELAAARAAAAADTRFFRICTVCDEVTSAGTMHDQRVCQGCASSMYGVLY